MVKTENEGRMMKLTAITTEEEYKIALAQIEPLMDAEPDSPQEKELERLAILVEEYEQEHFPIAAPDPIEVIRFRMEQQGLISQSSEGG
jgi:HTH-type transcriptional regulator/antitoxin HigA